MFSNMKIGNRIMLSVGIMLLLFTFAGFYSIYQMQTLSGLTQKLYRHPFAVSNAARDIDTLIAKMQGHMKDFALASDEIEQRETIKLLADHENKVLELFELIRDRFLGNKERVFSFEAKFKKWKQVRHEVLSHFKEGRREQGIQLSKSKSAEYAFDLEREASFLIQFASGKAREFMESTDSARDRSFMLISLILFLTFVITTGIAYLMIRSIREPLNVAVRVSEALSRGDTSLNVGISGKDETGILLKAMGGMLSNFRNLSVISKAIAAGDFSKNVTPLSEKDELGISMQTMTENLRANENENEQQGWLKDGIHNLSLNLSGNKNPDDICGEAISFICQYLNAGVGVFYIYDDEKDLFKLKGSYAFTERDGLSHQYRPGEGVVGQVAIEKKPILLKNIKRDEALITTGTTQEAPLNTYTYPLLIEGKVLGVVEIASFEPFDKIKQDFLTQSQITTANALSLAIQNQKITSLLERSELQSRELQENNSLLEEQQHQLQTQSEELQQTNSQLEEQQQQVEQQSEELKQSNAQLLDQQEQLRITSEDVSKKNQTLEKGKQELERMNRYKSQFLANMSHELRTPLNSIILLSRLLTRNENKNLVPKDVEKMQVIHNAGNELLRLINDILDLSKIEAGKVGVNKTLFSTSSLIQDLHPFFKQVAKEKGVRFILEDKVKTNLLSDRDKLSQILRNFLSNAFKFTSQGSVTLILAPSDEKNYPIKFSVTDTGIGIPAHKQETIFEAFHQADGSTSREYGGTGLGLSIAKNLAKLLECKVELQSIERQGTTLSLFIPAKVAKKEAPSNASGVHPKEDSSLLEGDDREDILAQDTVLLVIDDDKNFVFSYMVDAIRKSGAKALAAITAEEGLRLVRQFMPAGIFLDIMLPDRDGYDVLREIKSTKELKNIPVHIISAKEEDRRFDGTGISDFSSKPLDPDYMERVIRGMVSAKDPKSHTLLLVEDSERERFAIKEVLKSPHLTIDESEDVSGAIQKIETGKYDLILLDLKLKEGTGIDICRYVKEKELKTPIIIVTGKDLSAEKEKELKKYAQSIIIKTVNGTERLLNEVNYFLNDSTGRDNNQKYLGYKEKQSLGKIDFLDKTILIVDDDIKNVFVMTSALENFGATILDAQNGQEGLEVLRKNDVDIVLMDIMMPVMDGYETMRAIRSDPDLKELPLIAVTAKALKEDRAKCIAAGADDYISKPVDYDVLTHLLKAWIDKKNRKGHLST